MTLDHEGLHEDCVSCITTWKRRRVNPLAMHVQDIDIEDIAHALSKQVRYNGHTGGHLSVARHSIWVSDVALMLGNGDESLALWGLLHDASEAYMGDLVKPLKHSPFGIGFQEAEANLELVIAAAFDLPYPMPDAIKEADRIVTVEQELGEERRWTWDSSPEDDKRAFMAYYNGLWSYHRAK